MTDMLAGRRLDQFVLESRLGKGGDVSIYRAWDTHRAVYVALKIVERSAHPDMADFARRFTQEAQAVTRLHHPNIVRLYQYGEFDSLLYMATQYISGANLRTLLDQLRGEGETVLPSDALRLIRQVGAALDYAHSEGIVHGDVKPANIMIDAYGNAILTNFGLPLLREVESATPSPYIAPEQLALPGQAVPQSDLYSLGAVVYEIFAGQAPRDGNRILPSSLNPQITPELEAVIQKAMATSSLQRYRNGAALADALEQAVQPMMGRTTSQRTLAERVASELAAHPLPPPPSADAPPVVMPAAPTIPASQPYYSPPPVQPAPQPAAQYVPPPPPQPTESYYNPRVPTQMGTMQRIMDQRTQNPMLFGIIGILSACMILGICVVLWFLLGGGGGGNNNRAERTRTSIALNPPTSTSTNTPIPGVALPTLQATPTQFVPSIPTSAPNFPTSAPPLVIPTNPPPVVIPTNPPPIIALTNTPPNVPPYNPPADRSTVPDGVALLTGGVGLSDGSSLPAGDMQVEWFCNIRGLQIDNDNANWFCTQDGNTVMTLSAADFDEICRATYNRPDAFAIQSGNNPVPAYRWQCYAPIQ